MALRVRVGIAGGVGLVMTETNITERIARAICVSGRPGFVSCDQVCKFCDIDARVALQALADSGIPIDKLISGEYVAVPSDALDVLAAVTEDTLEMDGAQWREQDSIRVANAVTAVREAMLAAHKEQLS